MRVMYFVQGILPHQVQHAASVWTLEGGLTFAFRLNRAQPRDDDPQVLHLSLYLIHVAHQ